MSSIIILTQMNPDEPGEGGIRGPRPSRWFSPSLQLQYFLEVGNGKYGFGTPKPSGHRQLLSIGSSERLGGGPLLLASPPCPPCEPFRRHLQAPPTSEMVSCPGPV